MEVEGVHAFRVTRNADVDRNEEEADDLLAMISEELRERKFADVVRLEVEADMPERVRNLLLRELELEEQDDLWRSTACSTWPGIGELANVDLPEHQYLPVGVGRPDRACGTASSRRRPTSSRPSARATSWSTTPTKASRPRRSALSRGGRGPARVSPSS